VILAGVAVQHVAFAFVLLAAFGAGMIGAPFPGRERTPRVVHRAALAHACIIAAVGVAVCLTIAIRSPPPR
jgi:hypothetical protein